MRKVLWCCAAAVVFTTGSFLSLAYYACCCPDSVVGRGLQVIAQASLAMQPLCGLSTMTVRANQANEITAPVGEDILDDPQPITHERKEHVVLETCETVGLDAAPIVIPEDDPMPGKDAVPVAPPSVVLNERNFDLGEMQEQEVPPKGGPPVMPRCQDDEEGPVTPSKMQRADAGRDKEQSVFKAWMDLFAEGKEEKAPAVEELPPPQEEQPEAEPKCQEDSHLHEQYPGCPRTSCPYTGKDRLEKYFQRVWDLNSKLKKKGGEESSEEPPSPSDDPKDKGECPRTKGVDTMEYRKSDAGPDEYGPGQIH